MATQEYIDNMQQTIDNLPDFTQVAYTEEEEVQNEVQRRKMDQQRKYRQSLPFEERQSFDRMQIDRRLQKTKNDEEWAAGADERDRGERNEARLRAENPFYDYDQSSIGVESNINRRNLQQEMDDAQRQISRFGQNSPEQKEASRNYQNLRDSMDIFDAQLGESRQSWMSNPTSNSRVGPDASGTRMKDSFGNIQRPRAQQPQMQVPSQNPRSRQPQGQGQVRGMPQEFMQSPAMAQRRRSSRPYDARTGHSISDTQLNNFYRNDADLYRQVGGASPNAVAQNPFLKESNFNRPQPIGTNTNPSLRNMGY